jgi:heat shock protein HtpX
MGLTMFLIGLVYVLFIGVLIAVGVGAVIIVVIAGGVALVQLFFADKLALASMGAHPVTPEEYPELHAQIERLCQLSDIPKPRVAVARSDIPNAFACGRSPKTATVCVTTGILERLEPRELEGVLAHELSHIANRDVMVMTIAAFLATVAGLLIRFGIYGGMFGGGNNRDGNNVFAILAIITIVSVVVYALSFLLLRTLSRYREFAADRGAAIMTGSPARLAAALQKITGDMARIPGRDLRAAEGMNAFFIIPAISHRDGGFSLGRLIATHPPVEKRIERLLEMQRQIDSRAVSIPG